MANRLVITSMVIIVCLFERPINVYMEKTHISNVFVSKATSLTTRYRQL